MTKGELIAAIKDVPDDMLVEFSCGCCVFNQWHPEIKIEDAPNFLSEPKAYLSFHLEGNND